MEKTVIFKVDSALLDTFKAKTVATERTVSQQLRILMREFVEGRLVNQLTSSSPSRTKAMEKDELQKKRDAATKARYTELLTVGAASHPGQKITPEQIRITFRDSKPKERARSEALLQEVIKELGESR